MSGGILFTESGRVFSSDGLMFLPDSTPSPSMTMASGDILLDSSGNIWLDPSGNVILDSGTGDCCVWPARLCSDGSLTTYRLAKSAIPSFPYYVQRAADGICYEFLATDTARPLACGGTLIGTVTAFASCAACAGGGTGCPTYGSLPTTYTVGGLSGGFPLCDAAPHAGTSPCTWDFTLNYDGSTQWTITNCVTLGANSYFPVTGGSGYTTGWATLKCGSGGTTPPPGSGYWWWLSLSYDLANAGCADGFGGATADYYMAADPTSGAAGTYTLAGVVAHCDSGVALTCSMPATLTVS